MGKTKETEAKTESMYLVWSHEHSAWWGPGHCGYVPDVNRAGIYSRSEAMAIVDGATLDWSRPPNEVPVRIDDLPAGVLKDDVVRRATSDHVGAAVESLRKRYASGHFTDGESRDEWREALAEAGFTRVAKWYEDWCKMNP